MREKRMRRHWVIAMGLGLTLACDDGKPHTGAAVDPATGESLADGERGPSLSIERDTGMDARCPNGGRETASGHDDDADGLLSPDELTDTSVACTPGSLDEVVGAIAVPAWLGGDDGPCAHSTTPPNGAQPLLTVSVDGPGLIILGGPSGHPDTRLLTRAINLYVNDAGELRDGRGLALMGLALEAPPSLPLAPISAPLSVGPTPTGEVDITLNLSSTATPIVSGFDPLTPWTSSNFSSSVTVYDSLGAGHQITVFYAYQANGSWGFHATVEPTENATGELLLGSGTLRFDETGSLVGAARTTLSARFRGAAAQTFTLDFSGSTGFASPSNHNAISQDGFAAGSLSSLSLSFDGVLAAALSNGQSLRLAQLALANLSLDARTTQLCGGLWYAETLDGVRVDLPASGGSGLVAGAAP
jgi:flagellar hook-basal body protein